MEIQAQIPKIKLSSRSGNSSQTPSPRQPRSRRGGSQGNLAIKYVKTERSGEIDVEEEHILSDGTIKPKRLLNSISGKAIKVRHQKNWSATLSDLPKIIEAPKILNEKDPNQIDERQESEKGESSAVDESVISQDKMNASKGFQADSEKPADPMEQADDRPSSEKGPENAPEGGLAAKIAEDLQRTIHKKNLQKVAAMVLKAVSNLDELSREELISLAIQILMKPPTQRNSNEIKILVKCMSAVEFFKTYDQTTIEACLKHMYYVALKQDEKVFEIDTVGTNFWVTLKGSVGVVVNIPKTVGTNDKGEPIIEKVPTEVRVLPAGSAFGELALMNNNKRSATIVCKEDSEFAVLEKGPFKEILNEKAKKILYAQLDFLSSVPALKMLPYHIVHWLFYNIELTKRVRGQVVYDEGENSKGMFIIKSGEFKVLKTVDEDDEEGYAKSAYEKMKLKSVAKKTIELAILGPKEIFGEEEVLAKGNMKRKYAVVCHSTQAEVYEIRKEALEKKMLSFASMKRWLINYIEGKEEYYNKRLKLFRETRTDPKPLIPYYLDKPRGSPVKQYDHTCSSVENSKQWDYSDNAIPSQHLKRSIEESMRLAEKKKAILATQGKYAVPLKIKPRPNRDIQPLKLEQIARDANRSKSEAKGNNGLKNNTDQANKRLSLMKVNLDMLNSKKRFSRRCESFSKRAERSPKKSIDGSATGRMSGARQRPQEDSFTNSFNMNYRVASVTASENKMNPASAMYTKIMDSTFMDASVLDEIPRRRTLAEHTILDRIPKGLNRLGGYMNQYPATIDGYRADIPPSVFENKYTAMLYHKAIGKISWDSRLYENRSTISSQGQPFLGPKQEDTEDIRSYLLSKLNSKLHHFGSRNDMESTPPRDDGVTSFSHVSQIAASNTFKGIEGKSINPRRETKILKKTIEDEETSTRADTKNNYTPKIIKSKKEL